MYVRTMMACSILARGNCLESIGRLRGANLAKHLCGKEQKITSYDCDESEGL
mgnify:CR=1 FL=1